MPNKNISTKSSDESERDTLTHLRAEISRLRDDNYQMHLAVQSAELQLTQFIQSRSWKVTLPLRLASNQIKLISSVICDIGLSNKLISMMAPWCWVYRRCKWILKYIASFTGLPVYIRQDKIPVALSPSNRKITSSEPSSSQITVEELVQMF